MKNFIRVYSRTKQKPKTRQDNFIFGIKTTTQSPPYTQTKTKKIALIMARLESYFLLLQLIPMTFDCIFYYFTLSNHSTLSVTGIPSTLYSPVGNLHWRIVNIFLDSKHIFSDERVEFFVHFSKKSRKPWIIRWN